MNKKLFKIGVLASVAAPVATIISCGGSEVVTYQKGSTQFDAFQKMTKEITDALSDEINVDFGDVENITLDGDILEIELEKKVTTRSLSTKPSKTEMKVDIRQSKIISLAYKSNDDAKMFTIKTNSKGVFELKDGAKGMGNDFKTSIAHINKNQELIHPSSIAKALKESASTEVVVGKVKIKKGASIGGATITGSPSHSYVDVHLGTSINDQTLLGIVDTAGAITIRNLNNFDPNTIGVYDFEIIAKGINSLVEQKILITIRVVESTPPITGTIGDVTLKVVNDQDWGYPGTIYAKHYLEGSVEAPLSMLSQAVIKVGEEIIKQKDNASYKDLECFQIAIINPVTKKKTFIYDSNEGIDGWQQRFLNEMTSTSAGTIKEVNSVYELIPEFKKGSSWKVSDILDFDAAGAYTLDKSTMKLTFKNSSIHSENLKSWLDAHKLGIQFVEFFHGQDKGNAIDVANITSNSFEMTGAIVGKSYRIKLKDLSINDENIVNSDKSGSELILLK